ncbi:hypothetical protein F2Q70_00000542, partial [Brassica cretica]
MLLKPLMNREDSIIWGFTKNGIYIPRSGYHLTETLVALQAPDNCVIPPVEKKLWSNIWKIKAPSKLKHFFWRSLSGALAVKERLQTRGIQIDATCQSCGAGTESICHVFFLCNKAQHMWELANIPIPPAGFSANSVFLNIYHLVGVMNNSKLEMSIRRAVPWVLWQIWKARNSLAFKNTSLSPRQAVRTAFEEAELWFLLSKAITVPATTTIYDACKNMASRKVDALLLTDSNEMLCGILTDRDIATRVISQEVNVEETPVSKVMTRNPMFVLSETLAVDALQKMVLGKFRHLPVVENGEVIALLDIAKCLYDAIARMERAAEKGKAIAAAVEGVERSWGTNTSVHNTFIETLRDRMFRPSLSTIIPDDSKVLKVSPADTVLTVAKKMVELQSSCAVVMIEDKLGGIFTSKDILMRVVAENLPPSETTMEQVMTQNPESTSVDTPIVEALHIMHEGKFLHLPVTDKEGDVVAVVDVIHVTHAAVATAGTTAGIDNEATNTMMQTFWDSAMALSPNEEDEDTRSESSLKVASEAETGKSLPLPNKFSFKIEDKKQRMHRFIS